MIVFYTTEKREEKQFACTDISFHDGFAICFGETYQLAIPVEKIVHIKKIVDYEEEKS